METVTDGKVKVKSQTVLVMKCNLGCRTFWEFFKKINQIPYIFFMRENFEATFNWTLVIISTNEKDTSILVSVSCLDADRHRLGMWLKAGNIL